MIGIQLKIMEFDFQMSKSEFLICPQKIIGYGYLTFISNKTQRENFLCLQAATYNEFEIKF